MARVDEEDELDKKIKSYVLSAILGIGGVIALMAILSSFVTIDTGNVGVLLVFGQMKEVLHPGIHFVTPFISAVKVMSVQTMRYDVLASAASNDLQDVNTEIAVNYKISDNDNQVQYLYQQFAGDHENRIIAPMVQEAVKSATARYTAEQLITQRESVKQTIANALTEKLQPYGITIQEVAITNFNFSADFNKAIEQKVIVEQQKLQSQLELEQKQIEVQKLVAEQNATATAQVIQATADRDSAILRAEGDANATIVRAEAQRQAIDKVQHVLTPEYIQYLYSQQWNGKLPSVMVNGGSTGGSMFDMWLPPVNTTN